MILRTDGRFEKENSIKHKPRPAWTRKEKMSKRKNWLRERKEKKDYFSRGSQSFDDPCLFNFRLLFFLSLVSSGQLQ